MGLPEKKRTAEPGGPLRDRREAVTARPRQGDCNGPTIPRRAREFPVEITGRSSPLHRWRPSSRLRGC
jgi:hypothetical protein